MPTAQLTPLDLTRRYTYADCRDRQAELVELVKGRLLPPLHGPSRQHQDYVSTLLGQVLPFVRGRQTRAYHAPFRVRLPCTNGPADADAEVYTMVQPDLCVVCDPAKLDDEGCLGAPDWIVEVVTPGHLTRDTRIKFDLYEERGVSEYWLIFPGERTVVAYHLEKGRYHLDAEYAAPGLMPVRTLPGLALEWEELFGSR